LRGWWPAELLVSHAGDNGQLRSPEGLPPKAIVLLGIFVAILL
jgi:hypothetical protein